MAETVDAQATTIGVGTVVAIAFLAYGTVVSDSIAGIDATTAAAWTFAATFGAVALLHSAFGRHDMAAAYGVGTVGWALVLLGSIPLFVVVGLLLLVGGGAYIAIATIRAREEPTGASE